MNKLYLNFCFVLAFLFNYSQSNLNNALKSRIDNRTLETNFTVLVEANMPSLYASQQALNYKVNYSFGNIASVTLDLNALSALIENKIVKYAEFIEARKQVMNDTMVVRNRIKPVKLGAAPLSQAYDGTNVLVGIIDTGVDFNHPDFKDASGNTRIKFIWDQVPTGGSTVPMPYNYGIEWTAAQINASVCTHNDLPHYGHGTHVTGIAAGNGLANGTHEGCAPKADIVVVALDFNKTGPTIADAVQYIFSKATALGLPCVINASVGDYYGSHDCTDLEGKMIENMVNNIPGRVLVGAGGNAGNVKFHVKTSPPLNDTSFTWLKKSGTNQLFYWCYADTLQIKNVEISVGANRTNFSDLGRIGFKPYNYGLTTLKTDTLKKSNGNRIGIVKTSASINTYGVYELFVQVIPDSANLFWRVESKGVGLHNAWNFDFVSTGLPTAGQYPYISKYVKPDTLMTIVSGFQCSDEVITVANYNNLSQYYDVNNNLDNTGVIGGKLSLTSSIGPTRDGKQKPDISATGDYVFSAIPLSMLPNLITNAPTVVAQGSMHVQGGGTSAAAPVVAGLAALYLQYNPNATSAMVKNAIDQCAYSDSFTGTSLPNPYWGYGKLDGKAAILCVITDVKKNQVSKGSVKYFPNPFTSEVEFDFGKIITGELIVYSADGKIVFTDKLKGDSYHLNSSKFNAENGIYFVKVITPAETVSIKLVKVL